MNSTLQQKVQILAALNVKQIYGRKVELHPFGRNHKGLCPFHRENTPSFVVYPDKHFYCFGCQKGGSAFDFIMETYGWNFQSALGYLASQAGISLNGKASKGSPAGSGTDAAAITIATLARDKMLPNEFLRSLGVKESPKGVVIPYYLQDGSLASRQRIRTALIAGNGSYWDNEKGPLVPYGLQWLAEAREAGFIVIAEGESDSWTLRYHSFPCLGIPGASNTKCLDAEHIAGIKKIFIVQEPGKGGSGFVAGLTKRLAEIGWTGEPRVVSLHPYKDPNDLHRSNPETFPENFQAFLEAAQAHLLHCALNQQLCNDDDKPDSQDDADLQRIAADIGSKPAGPESKRSSGQFQGEQGLVLVPLSELLTRPDVPIDYVVEDLLVAGTVSMVVSKPKDGKSTFARNLCLCVSRGDDFLGRKTKKGECIYLALEEREEDVTKDFRIMGAKIEEFGKDGSKPIHVHAYAAPAEGVWAVCDMVREHRPVLVVIDPLFRITKIRDQNSYAEVYAALGPLIDIARETGTHIMLVHHSGKMPKTEVVDSPLGSIGLSGAVCCVLAIKRRGSLRTIQSCPRIGQELPETMLGFDPLTHRLSLGDEKSVADAEQASAEILARLESAWSPQTEDQIEEAVEGDRRVMRKALRQLVRAEKVSRTGGGKRGDPYKYISRFLAFSVSEARKREMENGGKTRDNTADILASGVSPNPARNEASEASFSAPVSATCWHCGGTKRCGCIACSSPGGPGVCVTCKGLGVVAGGGVQ